MDLNEENIDKIKKQLQIVEDMKIITSEKRIEISQYVDNKNYDLLLQFLMEEAYKDNWAPYWESCK
jgi:hypothetical protein